MKVTLKHVGVATILITVNDTTFINDPCFDEAGGWYHHGLGAFSKKTEGPRLGPNELDPKPDFALVTHGHHRDNLDASGRKFLERIPAVVTTHHSANSISGATGLSPGENLGVSTGSSKVEIHAVSARHGVFPLSKLAGPVNGYVLEFGPDPARIYVSGDTIYSDEIATEVQSLGEIDLFIPHLGNARFPYLSGPFRYTMNSDDLLRFVDRLHPTYTYPIHNEGWSHFRPVDLSRLDDLGNQTTLLTETQCKLTL